MAEVASAYVSLLPSARGFGSKLGGEISGDIKSAGKKSGISFGKVFAGAAALALGAKAFSFLGDSLGEATEAAVVGSRTENVIEKMGNAANISADQVSKLAGAISAKSGIDDEAIQSGQNLLLTFGNIRNEAGKGNDIFNQTSQLMVDLSSAMGTDAKSAALQLGKALNDPTEGVAKLTRSGVSFTEQQKEQIKTLQESGDMLGAQNIILGEVKKQFGGAAEAMATPADRARVAFGNLKELIGTKLLPVANNVLDFFVDHLPGAIETASGYFATIRDAVTKFYDKVSTNEVVIGAIEAVGDATKFLKDGLGDAVENAKKIGAALGNVDLSKLDAGDLGKKLGEAIASALDSLVTLAGKASEIFGKMFAKVDWVGLGISIGKQVPALLTGLAVGILAFDPMPILKGLADNWGTVLIAVLSLAFAPAKLLGPLTRMLARIPFVGRFLAAGVTWFNDIGRAFGGRVMAFLGDLGRAFTQGFGRLKIPGAGLVKNVLGAFKSIPGRVSDFISTLGTRIGVWALDAFEAMGKGARTAVGGLLRFVGGIPGMILRALGSLLKTLSPRGYELIAGFLQAAKSRFTSVVAYLGAIPARLLGALGDLGSLFYNKGAELIAGLIRGISAKMADAVNAVKAGLQKIKDMLPGSPIKDGPLKPWNSGRPGEMLMEFLAKGITKGGEKTRKALESELDKLKSALSTMKSDFASLAESVASSLTGDLFGVTAIAADAEAGIAGKTVGQAFIDNLTAKKGELTALLASFKTLAGWGIAPAFLSQLFASGNGALITELAGMGKSGAVGAASLFGEVSSLGDRLGSAVATNDIGPNIDKTTAEIAELRKDIAKLPEKNAKAMNNVRLVLEGDNAGRRAYLRTGRG